MMSLIPNISRAKLNIAFLAAGLASAAISVAHATDYKMTTPIPPEILTPDSVETRIGTLTFNDGVPTAKTAQKVWDQLDFSRGI